MSSFRKLIPIKRRSDGSWINGKWIDGAETADTIMASVQPATSGDYDRVLALLEGRRVDGMVRIYTTAILNIAGEGLSNGDLLVWQDGQQSRDYLFIARSPWQSGVIPHFRYLAALLPEPIEAN